MLDCFIYFAFSSSSFDFVAISVAVRIALSGPIGGRGGTSGAASTPQFAPGHGGCGFGPPLHVNTWKVLLFFV